MIPFGRKSKTSSVRLVTTAALGEVMLKKSSRAKRIILRLSHNGQIQITLPRYAPYRLGLEFALHRQDWIEQRLAAKPILLLENGQMIGQYQLQFEARSSTASIQSITSRLANQPSPTITVRYPAELTPATTVVQLAAQRATDRAIKQQALQQLPALLAYLASRYGYHPQQVRVKKMRSRWGSCSSRGLITLNSWLVLLPDDLISYVCCHELTHLRQPHHQAAFWVELETMLPDAKAQRRRLKKLAPDLASLLSFTAGV